MKTHINKLVAAIIVMAAEYSAIIVAIAADLLGRIASGLLNVKRLCEQNSENGELAEVASLLINLLKAKSAKEAIEFLMRQAGADNETTGIS